MDDFNSLLEEWGWQDQIIKEDGQRCSIFWRDWSPTAFIFQKIISEFSESGLSLFQVIPKQFHRIIFLSKMPSMVVFDSLIICYIYVEAYKSVQKYKGLKSYSYKAYCS